jgi:esterase/lipase superfamily enzyme
MALVLAAAFHPMPSAAQTGASALEVPFLTVRNRTGSDAPETAFGDRRSVLSAGRCRVRELDLRGLSPIADAAPNFLREELLRVDRVTEAGVAELFEDVRLSSGERAPALYVHGYYIDFEKGCRRAVLLQRNAGLEGRFLWFTWPSDGALASYARDEADLYWSVPDIVDAIIELERIFGSSTVDVVGHSLGARGVVLALYEIANRRPDIRLDQVVLLAPDMDHQIFERMLPRIAPIAGTLTVYVTTGDRPLALSAQLHGYPRLGEAGAHLSGLEGVDIIDLSELPTGSPTGHLYHLYSPEVGADLGRILNERLGATERGNLVPEGGRRWRLVPEGDLRLD